MKPIARWVRKDPSFLKIGSSNGCRSTGSKQRGILYHRRTYTALRGLFGALSGSKSSQTEGWELLVEPWYYCPSTGRFRQPDAVLLYPAERVGIVVEVKLNWKDGRDVKLIDEYLPIVKSAEGLDVVWPLLITQCLRGYQGEALKGLKNWHQAQSWFPGEITPVMLHI
jgi:hypothetical protein